MEQTSLIQALGGPDPAQDLVTLLGVNRRTAERWASGASTMPPHVIESVEDALHKIDQALAVLEATGIPPALLIVAARRLKSNPLY